jgi:GTP-binding protein Era
MTMNNEETSETPAVARPGDADWPHGRVGYIALLGRPNTGKSTFLNSLLEYHLSAVSSKPQTTRRNWMGIFNDIGSQMLFLDCPGVHVSQNKLDESMERSIMRAIKESDAVLCLFDPTRAPGAEDRLVTEFANTVTGHRTLLVAINKIDIATTAQLDNMQRFVETYLPGKSIFAFSATTRQGVPELLAALKAALPEGPFLFPADVMTDAMERQIAQDLIREAVLDTLSQEVPHCIAVTIDSYTEKPKAVLISATLHVETDGQKGIVIGRGGERLDQIHADAIKRLREIIDIPVRLKLHVKVDPGWRNSLAKLREFEVVDPITIEEDGE